MNIIRQFKEKKGGFYRFYLELEIISDRIEKHHLFMQAAGIAFNVMVYLIPLILIVIFIVSIFLDAEQISRSLEDLLKEFLPPTESVNKIIHQIVDEVAETFEYSSFFGYIGIAGLLWISSMLVSSLRYGLNTIFELESPKIFFFYRMKDILLTLGMTVMILLYSFAIPLLSVLNELMQVFFPDFMHSFVSGTIVRVGSIISSLLLFFFIYRLVPNTKLPSKLIFMSTIICVVAIEVARNLFAIYLTELSNYGRFYGTYAVVASTAIWIYYSSLIILLSAELSNYWYDRKKRKKHQKA